MTVPSPREDTPAVFRSAVEGQFAGRCEQTVTTMTDDIDGSEATQTVGFSDHGRSCSIDLDSNASEFDDALATCIDVSSSHVDPKAVRARARPTA